MRRLLLFLRPVNRSSARRANRPPDRGPTESRSPEGRSPNVGSYYRSATLPPLSARQVRERRFPLVRRGLDPTEVDTFLHRVAGELAAARHELASIRDENVRIKGALRAWQSRFTPGARE